MASTSSSLPIQGIRSSLAGRSIFLTGGLGFLGKALLEKLLRSVPEIGKIYLLVRSKKDAGPKARVEKFLQESRLFAHLREEDSTSLSKVIAVSGDITDDNLGMTESDMREVISTVSIVVHSAATVRFDECLRTALQINLKGTMNVVALCRQLEKLEVFLHVSTAYSQCTQKEIEERFYPMNIPPQKLLDMSEWINDDLESTLEPRLVGSNPNTYIFSKALTEHWLSQEVKDLPMIIFRPSIITGSWDEPEPGWLDGLNGPHSFVVGMGTGMLRIFPVHREKVGDFIPVDFCARMMICAIWDQLVKRSKKPVIYHCCTSPTNPITFGIIIDTIVDSFHQNPAVQMVQHPCVRAARTIMAVTIMSFFCHTIPAYLFDFFSAITGRRRRMVKISEKLHGLCNILRYFTTHQWTWHYSNSLNLLDRVPQAEKEEFGFEMRQINWVTYWANLCFGARKYILKEDPANIPYARKRAAKLRVVRYIKISLLSLSTVYALYYIGHQSSLFRQLWFSLVALLLQSLQRLHDQKQNLAQKNLQFFNL